MFRGAGDLQKLENCFEDLLATNRALIEGVRGIFTFLVLYDHFHNPHNAISSSFSADTYLFVMISGFTTALQLRETAQFVHVEPDDVCEIQLNPILNGDTQNTHNNQNNNSNNHSVNDYNSAMDSPRSERNERNGREADIGRVRKSSITEDSQGLFTSTSPTVGGAEWFSVSVKGGTGPAGLKLLPRKSFNIRSFIVSRCVGLYPILWVALLLNIPPWINVHVNDDKVNNTQKAVCSVLYVIGMQSWYRPTCHLYGPNNLLYASIILNCFILYGIGRMILMTLQNHLMTYASEELSPLTLRPPRRIRRSRTWKQWVGDKAVLLAYNRTDMSTMLVMVSFWILVVLGLFTFMLYNTFAKVRFFFFFSFFLYFLPFFFLSFFLSSYSIQEFFSYSHPFLLFLSPHIFTSACSHQHCPLLIYNCYFFLIFIHFWCSHAHYVFIIIDESKKNSVDIEIANRRIDQFLCHSVLHTM